MRTWGLGVIWLVLLQLVPVPAGWAGKAARMVEVARPVAADSRQILFLNTYPIGLPIPDSIDQGLLAAIQEGGGSLSDIIIEHLDLTRCSSGAYRRLMAELLRRKLADKNIGVVIAEGRPVLDFLRTEGKDLFPDAVLLTLVTPDIGPALARSTRVVDIPWQVDPAGTLRLALELFPETRKVVVVTGANDSILPFLDQARQAFVPWMDSLEFEYTDRLDYEQMLHRVSSLPDNSIVIYSPYFSDTTGRFFVPAEVVAEVSRSANAPVFATLDAYLGHGIVGGSLLKTERIGRQVGKVALDYLAGRLAADQPVTTLATVTERALDWQELDRWKVSIRALPDDAVIINRPHSLWRQYRGTVIAVAIAFGGLVILILGLWTFNRRLQRVMAMVGDSEARVRVMMEHAPEAILVYDFEEKKVVDANPKAARLFGCPKETLLGEEPARFFRSWTSTDTEEELDRYHARANDGGEVSFEREIRTYNGASVPCEVRLVTLPFRGQKLMRASFIDITERKRTEEQRAKLEAQLQQSQKLEAIGQMAGGVAHDFNNMLAVILGYTELAMRQVDRSQPIYSELEEIHAAALHSVEITRQLLAFARKQAVAPEVVNLNATLESLLKMLRRLIGEDIELIWRPGEELWNIKVDPGQLDQILANLCVNARAAIDGVGKIVVETGNDTFDEAYCSRHTDFVPGEYVRLAVTDDGCGMSEELMDHIFEPFYTTKPVGEGTGLGLATVYGAVIQNNGFIKVTSEVDRGSTFALYFPRYRGAIEQKPPKKAANPVIGGQETILLVEDQENLLFLTECMLQDLGYKVLAARGPREAIRKAGEAAGAIDLLVTDVIMPEMNGRDLVDLLLADHPELKCLFMSGYSADILIPRGRLDDRMRFLQKPFSKTDLAAKVRQALHQEGGHPSPEN